MIFSSLKDHLLIAMPSLASGFFNQSVTYLCEHDENGAMGIVINKPLEFELEHVLAQLDIARETQTAKRPVFKGGPVQQEHGFILHRFEQKVFDSTLVINDEIALTTSIDIMQAIGRGEGPSQYLLALGYAGWGAGQLEQEIIENSWLTVPATAELIFDTPRSHLVQVAASQLGLDMNLMPTHAGHA